MLVKISEIVKHFGSQKALASHLGINANQITRWKQACALIDLESGEVYFMRTEKVKDIKGELMDNVKQVNFNTNYKILEEVEKDILAVAEKYDGQVSLAAFIGILEIVKQGFLSK